MKSIKSRKNLILTLVVIALIAVFFVWSFHQRSKIALPSHVDTLAKFSVEMPKPERVIIFEKNGSSYVEVIGLPPRAPTTPVPSGPPAYIFDSTGHLSYWTVDVGDSTEYWKKWQNRVNSHEVSMRDALEFVKGAKQ